MYQIKRREVQSCKRTIQKIGNGCSKSKNENKRKILEEFLNPSQNFCRELENSFN
jgi:hypothetical protein